MANVLQCIQEDAIFYSLIVLAIVLWFRWRWKRISIFQELGIPGPKPSLFFGNILELNRKGLMPCQEEWIGKYGKVLGYYHGMQPILQISDPDLIKKIFVKDFQMFSDRPEIVPLRKKSFLDFVIPAAKVIDSMLANLRGEKWKEVRSILTPTFSAAKLKMMIPAVKRQTDVALSILAEKCEGGRPFDMYDLMQRLTLDIICEQAFALDTRVQQNPEDPFLKSARLILGMPFTSRLYFFGMCFPEFGFLTMTINFVRMLIKNKFSVPPLKITSLLGEAIKQRRENPQNHPTDLLQLLIEASAPEEEDQKTSNELKEDEKKTSSARKKKLRLSDLEIRANSLVVFLAGYETTGTALSFAFHFLVKHPEIQEQLQEEIDRVMKEEGELNYYSLNKLQSLDRFMSETLRMYPPAFNFLTRVAVCDMVYGDVRIPKGMLVQVPVLHMHKNADYWEDPETFDPDRFLVENKSRYNNMCYMPFGLGPRNCLGIRLVFVTTSIVLAKILGRFRFTSGEPDAEAKVSVNVKVNTMVPDRVILKVFERNSPISVK